MPQVVSKKMLLRPAAIRDTVPALELMCLGTAQR